MFGTHDLSLFVLSGLLLNITPGADSLFMITRSVTQGARAGAVAALWFDRGVGAIFVFLGLRVRRLPRSPRFEKGVWRCRSLESLY